MSCDTHSPLPHPLYPPSELELCLLTKSDKTTTKELLESKGISGVTKVRIRDLTKLLNLPAKSISISVVPANNCDLKV